MPSLNTSKDLEDLINSLKVNVGVWEDVIAKSIKYQNTLKMMTQASSDMLDSLHAVCDIANKSSCGLKNTGINITRLVLREKKIEQKISALNNQLNESFVVELEKYVNEWRKTSMVLKREREHDWKKANVEYQKSLSEVERTEKKLRKKNAGKVGLTETANLQIEYANQDAQNKRRFVEELERSAMRRAAIEERQRVKLFLHLFKPILDCQLSFREDLDNLSEVISQLYGDKAENFDELPEEIEQIIQEHSLDNSSNNTRLPRSYSGLSRQQQYPMGGGCGGSGSNGSHTSLNSGTMSTASSNAINQSLGGPSCNSHGDWNNQSICMDGTGKVASESLSYLSHDSGIRSDRSFPPHNEPIHEKPMLSPTSSGSGVFCEEWDRTLTMEQQQQQQQHQLQYNNYMANKIDNGNESETECSSTEDDNDGTSTDHNSIDGIIEQKLPISTGGDNHNNISRHQSDDVFPMPAAVLPTPPPPPPPQTSSQTQKQSQMPPLSPTIKTNTSTGIFESTASSTGVSNKPDNVTGGGGDNDDRDGDEEDDDDDDDNDHDILPPPPPITPGVMGISVEQPVSTGIVEQQNYNRNNQVTTAASLTNTLYPNQSIPSPVYSNLQELRQNAEKKYGLSTLTRKGGQQIQQQQKEFETSTSFLTEKKQNNNQNLAMSEDRSVRATSVTNSKIDSKASGALIYANSVCKIPLKSEDSSKNNVNYGNKQTILRRGSITTEMQVPQTPKHPCTRRPSMQVDVGSNAYSNNYSATMKVRGRSMSVTRELNYTADDIDLDDRSDNQGEDFNSIRNWLRGQKIVNKINKEMRLPPPVYPKPAEQKGKPQQQQQQMSQDQQMRCITPAGNYMMSSTNSSSKNTSAAAAAANASDMYDHSRTLSSPQSIRSSRLMMQKEHRAMTMGRGGAASGVHYGFRGLQLQQQQQQHHQLQQQRLQQQQQQQQQQRDSADIDLDCAAGEGPAPMSPEFDMKAGSDLSRHYGGFSNEQSKEDKFKQQLMQVLQTPRTNNTSSINNVNNSCGQQGVANTGGMNHQPQSHYQQPQLQHQQLLQQQLHHQQQQLHQQQQQLQLHQQQQQQQQQLHQQQQQQQQLSSFYQHSQQMQQQSQPHNKQQSYNNSRLMMKNNPSQLPKFN